MKEAQELMEKAQKMDKLIADEKKDMEKRRNKIKKSILSKTCQKAAKNLQSFLDGPSSSKGDTNNNFLE